MGHLLGVIDQARLDEQRGVVQNEKRQGENQPYGQAFNLIQENTFPKGHPYSWTVIGSMEDLSAASLDDVKEWFKTYYGAANAILVVAGDVERGRSEEEGRAVLRRHPRRPARRPARGLDRQAHGRRTASRCRTASRRRASTRSGTCPRPARATTPRLDLLASVLASGKTSRLYKRLVYDDQIATDVSAFQWSREIAGLFVVQRHREARRRPRPGRESHRRGDGARCWPRGPPRKSSSAPASQDLAGFVRGVERIGGFGGKSDVLARARSSWGSPTPTRLATTRCARPRPPTCSAAAKRWLSDGVYVLEVHPFPELKNASADVDRSKVPEAGTPPAGRLPAFSAGEAVERPEAGRGRAARGAGGELQPAGGRRLRRRPDGRPGHGQAGRQHARRGHQDPDCAPDQR